LIAWLTHAIPRAEDSVNEPNLLPGKYAGGAEMTDAAYIDASPETVEIIHSNNWEAALDYETVIVAGTDALPNYAMHRLAEREPVVMLHHRQSQTEARAKLLSSARMLICHTPRHLEIETSWTSPRAAAWVISHHDPSEFTTAPKEDFALWAARRDYQKGLDNAVRWASENKIKLETYWDKPREVVLETMSRAKHFVFLPNDFDAEPRTLIEAVLSGCEIHTNNLAGITSIPDWRNPDQMSELVSTANQRFWELAL
jgi:hypothetical protein